jgi:hypothetical protein
MKHFKLFSASLAVAFTLLTACQKERDSTIAPLDTQKLAAQQSTQLTPVTQAQIAQLIAALPKGTLEKLQQKSALLVKLNPEYRDIIGRAIQPKACNSATPLNLWLDQQLDGWEGQVINDALDLAMLDLPTYDALVFENSSANQYFGINGDYTQRLTKAFKDLQRFWNIESKSIVLAAMHGNMLLNHERVARTYVAAFGVPSDVASQLADIVVLLADQVPQYRDGNHPIFTFNAFAQSGFNFPPYGVIPDKIIMGDGILEAYNAIGYSDVAPQAILAHEFGHHIQFQLNLFTDENSPEATRRTELMADAYSAYYLSHARGASMQWKRVKQFLQVFFNIGDCSITSNGHHGTPAQRMAAAEWGYSVANNAQKQGHILSAQEFTRLFEAQLPVFVSL